MVRPDGEGYRARPLADGRSCGAARRTIWGGTAEVQRNIVGERVLGLPKEPERPGARR